MQKLDVAPRQVLIEATIAEVTLTGALQYGLQWFFNNNIGSRHDGSGSLGIDANNLTINSNSVLGGRTSDGAFSYVITGNGSGAVRALLNTLASDSKVKVLSSPHVMVVDNQQAVIRVGTQQPISQGTVTTTTTTTSGGYDYKDTGVLLEVLPRVNSGGMVSMEVKQEVVDLGNVVDVSSVGSQTTQAREFLERSITSKVVVKSGQTLVLGGLISENRSEGQSGFPVLYKVPVLGALFGNTGETSRRTELIVLITPRVVRNDEEAYQVTEEIKRKMQEAASTVPAS